MITVTDEFTSELHLTLSDDAVALHLVDVDGLEVEVILTREDMRHLLTAGESAAPRLAGSQEEGAQMMQWDVDGEPAYRLALWDADMVNAGGALTFYPRRSDFDLLGF